MLVAVLFDCSRNVTDFCYEHILIPHLKLLRLCQTVKVSCILYCLMKNLFIYLLILLSWFVCFGGFFCFVCLKHVPRFLSNPMLLHADRALLPSRAPTCISSSNLCRNFTLVLGFWAQHCFRRGGPWDSEELWLFIFFPWWLRIGHFRLFWGSHRQDQPLAAGAVSG